MKPGDWIIDDFIIPWVITAAYDKNSIKLSCLAYSDGYTNPKDEIDYITNKMVLDYDNSYSISGGTVLQGFNTAQPLLISNGYQRVYGHIVGLTFNEDNLSDQRIIYELEIAIYKVPNKELGLYHLPDGDEVLIDDDWEEGFENYTPPVEDENNDISSNTIDEACSDPYIKIIHEYPQTYYPKTDYNNLIRLNPLNHLGGSAVEGIPLLQESPSVLPRVIGNYTVEIDLPYMFSGNTPLGYAWIMFCINYGDIPTKSVEGNYGEEILVIPNIIPNKRFWCNGNCIDIPYNGEVAQTLFFPLNIENRIVFCVSNDTSNSLIINRINHLGFPTNTEIKKEWLTPTSPQPSFNERNIEAPYQAEFTKPAKLIIKESSIEGYYHVIPDYSGTPFGGG
jgi:hypothetical protein